MNGNSPRTQGTMLRTKGKTGLAQTLPHRKECRQHHPHQTAIYIHTQRFRWCLYSAWSRTSTRSPRVTAMVEVWQPKNAGKPDITGCGRCDCLAIVPGHRIGVSGIGGTGGRQSIEGASRVRAAARHCSWFSVTHPDGKVSPVI